jgi:hypothetical protein
MMEETRASCAVAIDFTWNFTFKAALRPGKMSMHVRFGSEADKCAAIRRVRFTPNSDRKSRHAAMVMSASPLKADMCGATSDVG